MKRCLMVMLLIALLMPTIYATPQEPEEQREPTASELYSGIKADTLYPGEFVKRFADILVAEASAIINRAYQEGVMQGAAMAARPLQARIEGLEAWQDEAKKKIGKGIFKTVLFVAGGVLVGLTVGALAK